jgi:hypothetical protein
MITRLCLHPNNTCLHAGTLHTVVVKNLFPVLIENGFISFAFFQSYIFHLPFMILYLYFPDRQHFSSLALLFFVLSYSLHPPPIFSTTIFLEKDSFACEYGGIRVCCPAKDVLSTLTRKI